MDNFISLVPQSIVFLEKLVVASGSQEMCQLYVTCYSEVTERSSMVGGDGFLPFPLQPLWHVSISQHASPFMGIRTNITVNRPEGFMGKYYGGKMVHYLRKMWNVLIQGTSYPGLSITKFLLYFLTTRCL
jgi:hypothetical protein